MGCLRERDWLKVHGRPHIFWYFCFIFVNFVTFLIESSVVCTHFDENNDNFIQIGGNWQDYGNQTCYLQDEQNSNTIDKGKLYITHIIYSSFQKDDITIRFRLLHLYQISWTEFAKSLFICLFTFRTFWNLWKLAGEFKFEIEI